MGPVSISSEFVDCVATGEDRKEAKRKQQEYLSEYFERMNMRVYWGDAREFARELKESLPHCSDSKEEDSQNDV